MNISAEHDLTAIGVLAGRYRVTVQTIEGVLTNLSVRAWRLNGILHFDRVGCEAILAELNSAKITGRTRPQAVNRRRFQ